eukprot:COSAG03_NODE_17104_length_384_cov_0.698246_2_plen_89_part_01
MPILDTAYQGFASGDPERDAYCVRRCACYKSTRYRCVTQTESSAARRLSATASRAVVCVCVCVCVCVSVCVCVCVCVWCRSGVAKPGKT